MAVSINQKPLFLNLPVGQEVIFTVAQNTLVATMFNVKFVAALFVSDRFINFASPDQLVGYFKTTPNNVGVGMFNFSSIIESYVSPDYEGLKAYTSNSGPVAGSQYKTGVQTHPIHLIDKYSLNKNAVRYFAVQFLIEYSTTVHGDVMMDSTEAVNSDKYIAFNGVLQYDDILEYNTINYGYNLQNNNFLPFDSGTGADKFLTNAPKTQYARLTDYGTLPFLQFMPDVLNYVQEISNRYYDSAGSLLASETIVVNPANGGTGTLLVQETVTNLVYAGVFPANLRGWNSQFAQQLAAGADIAYYTVQATTAVGGLMEPYTINIICPNERGYEGIRLTWLNQWGAWDYYTFNMKSIKSISTNKSTWTQLGGTWNEDLYKIAGYKGGKKNLRVNATEKIKLNTDFVTEEEGQWFEELINSPEVYIVNEYSTDVANTITNKYIEPVRLTTSSYIKKTVANDKLMQYTIEIEKSKTKRTQAV